MVVVKERMALLMVVMREMTMEGVRCSILLATAVAWDLAALILLWMNVGYATGMDRAVP